MQDKGSTKDNKKKSVQNPEQRSRRIQQVLFGALALVMVISMVISLIAR